MSAIAVAVAAAGYMSSQAQKKAGEEAAAAQTAASQAGISEERRQFERIRELLAPYVQAGTGAIGAQQTLIGLGGEKMQRQAIQALQQSPQFQALQQQGENALLQSASATGGLRGGNLQAALAQFRPSILSNLINQQYNRLGGLATLGQASAAGQAASAQQLGTNIANLLGEQGAAQAGSALASGRAQSDAYSDYAKAAGIIASKF